MFTQGICNYILETNYVSRVHSVTAVPYLQFVLHVLLLHMVNKFSTFKLALSEVYVQYIIIIIIIIIIIMHLCRVFTIMYQIKHVSRV